MKINDLFESQEQTLDEGPIGQAIGKGVGAVARGAGAVAGGAVGAWQAAKQGYQAGKATVSGQPAPAGSAAPGQTAGAVPANGGVAQGPAGSAPTQAAPGQTQAAAPVAAATNQTQAAPAGNTAAAPVAAAGSGAAPAAGGQQDQQAKVGVGQINKIIPTLRTRDLQSVKKNLDATIAKKQKQPADAAAPAGNAPAAPADAGQQAAAPAGPQPDQVVKLASGESYKWLGQQWAQVDPASGKQVGSFVEPNIQKSLTKLAAQQSAAPAAPAAGTPNLKVVPGGKQAAPAAAVGESRDFRSKFLEMLI
jgi:hypothetical protein